LTPSRIATNHVPMTTDRSLPPALAAANALAYDYDRGRGFDFEPYSAFRSAEETAAWLRAWTGNRELDGHEYRVFGQDGTGGVAALWLVREEQSLEAQPVVFFGSEGSVGVVARDVADYLWLLAGGLGPMEAVEFPEARPIDAVKAALAKAHAAEREKPALEVIRLAREEFPDFEPNLRALCR
jgi:hypothetical protein